MEIVSLVAGVVSVVLAVFAVWLSVTFYKWTTDASDKIEAASREIASNVERLDALFSRMYSDTFAMVRDSYDDMRKGMWTGPSQIESTQLVPTEADTLQASESIDAPAALHTPEKSVGKGAKKRPAAQISPSLGGEKAMSDLMDAALPRMWERGDKVTAGTLTAIAENAGFDVGRSIKRLFDMRSEGKFYIADEMLNPRSELFQTKEEAVVRERTLLDERINESLRLPDA